MRLILLISLFLGGCLQLLPETPPPEPTTNNNNWTTIAQGSKILFEMVP